MHEHESCSVMQCTHAWSSKMDERNHHGTKQSWAQISMERQVGRLV